MKHSALYIATLALLPMTAFSAGLERTPQSIAPFLQDGNYAEFSLNVIDPTIKGVEKDRPITLDDSSETYHTKSLALLIANVKETEIGQIAIGQPAQITVDALSGKGGGKQVLTGKVVQIAPATGSEFSANKTDPSTGNFIKVAQRVPVKIAFDDNQPNVKEISMGMSAVVRIEKVAK